MKTIRPKQRKAPWTTMHKAKPKPVQRTRIAPVSKRNRARMAAYRREAKAWIAEHRANGTECVVARKIFKKSVPVEEVHHKIGRLGSLLHDKRHWMPIARQSHQWLHANLKEAALHGWIDLQNWNKP